MRAAIYARVSTNKQAKNYSIPTQLEAMREHCQRNNWEVAKEYIEDESGAKLNRPALDEVREDVAQGLFDVLVCHDVDRFGRNLGHQILLEEEFTKQGVTVRYVLGDYKNNPEGTLNKHLKGVIAEYEREKTLERTFRGRLARSKSGQVSVGSRNPYGYMYKNDGKGKHGWLEISIDESEVVKKIYRLYVEERVSPRVIAAELTKGQIPTWTKAQQWSPSSIRQILRNETYAGVWYDNKHKNSKGVNDKEDWIPVGVPPIISKELWKAAQEVRAKNREGLRRQPKYPYLLSGLLRCGNCGRAFGGRSTMPSRDLKRKYYHYYRCSDNDRTWKNQRCLEPQLNAQ